MRTLLKSRPPLVKRDFDNAPAESLDRFDLRVGRSSGRDHCARNAKPARAPRHTLGHVTCRRRNDSALELLRWQVKNCIRGAANLERSNRLQVFELEVDLGRSIRHMQA